MCQWIKIRFFIMRVMVHIFRPPGRYSKCCTWKVTDIETRIKKRELDKETLAPFSPLHSWLIACEVGVNWIVAFERKSHNPPQSNKGKSVEVGGFQSYLTIWQSPLRKDTGGLSLTYTCSKPDPPQDSNVLDGLWSGPVRKFGGKGESVQRYHTK